MNIPRGNGEESTGEQPKSDLKQEERGEEADVGSKGAYHVYEGYDCQGHKIECY